MDRRLKFGLIAAAAIVGLILILPFVVPVGVWRGPIEQSAGHVTGRTLRIDGGLRLTLFPQLGVRAGNVVIANEPGGRAPAFATIDDMRVSVRLLPLFVGRIEVSQIVLDRPQIHLEVDTQGRSNWNFRRAGAQANPGKRSRLSADTHFSGVQIVNGSISYFNARSGAVHKIDNLDASVDVTDLDHPLTIDGAFVASGRPVSFDAKITPLPDRITGANLSLTSNLLQASFKGRIASGGLFAGHIKIDTPSVRAAGAWLGSVLPAGQGLRALSLESQIEAREHSTVLDALSLTLDGTTMRGRLDIDTRNDVPRIAGALTLDHLDLNPYLEKPAKGGSTTENPSHGWSTKPIALDLLKSVNADLVLNVESLRVKRLKLGRTKLDIALQDRMLNVGLDPITLYGGTGRAELTVDDRGPIPLFRDMLQFHGAAIQPLLADTLGIEKIDGTGTLTLDLSSRGDNANAIMHALSGKGAIAFRNGHIRGVDLGAVARTIAFVLSGGSVGQSAITNYSELGGTFAIANGVLSSKDFQLAGPLLHMTGNGNVDIGNRAIDFRVEPKAAATIAHQNLLNIGIPFRIKGPWNHVHYNPDLAGIAKGVLQNLENGRAPFKGLFSPPKNAPRIDPNAPKKKHKSIGAALKNMFGIH